MAQFRVRAALPESMLDQENLSRKGAKAQRKPFRNAAALCAFAPLREKLLGKACLPKQQPKD
jgi:hypothetical protein